ncbi:MAG TPA: FecR domain-containing protein [Polyangiaceae bacterium]|nr:FecR domain-containing protein [Polyangiaceae bacterium]
MTKLRAPLSNQLDARADDATLQRIWGRIGARRHGSRIVARRTRAWLWGFAGAALVLALTLIATHWPRQPAHAALSSESGPLTARSGESLSVLGEPQASTRELADGSTIALDAGSRLEILANDSHTFASVLREGRGNFSVRPGGPRRWVVEAGLATVEVVGTRFSVARLASAVLVKVEHGTVLVRSSQLRDDVQRLTAGQELLIRAPEATHLAQVEPAPASAALPPSNSGSSAPANGRPSLDALLTRATDQRRRGDWRGAEDSLRQALAEHAAEPQAALAAFTLGKLLLDNQGRPAEAARAFSRCLSLSPPASLAEDAWFRLIEAHAKSGNAQAAEAAAREYRARYPAGRHTRDLARWLHEH